MKRHIYEEKYETTINNNLEWILKEKLSFDTNAMDFFISIGWWVPFYSNFYKTADFEIKTKIDKFLLDRKKATSQNIRGLEKRFVNYILKNINSYKDISQLTIRDIQKIIATQGMMTKDVGYKTLGHFTNTMKHYGLEGFKVKVSNSLVLRRDVQKQLKEYCLESVYSP